MYYFTMHVFGQIKYNNLILILGRLRFRLPKCYTPLFHPIYEIPHSPAQGRSHPMPFVFVSRARQASFRAATIDFRRCDVVYEM